MGNAKTHERDNQSTSIMSTIQKAESAKKAAERAKAEAKAKKEKEELEKLKAKKLKERAEAELKRIEAEKVKKEIDALKAKKLKERGEAELKRIADEKAKAAKSVKTTKPISSGSSSSSSKTTKTTTSTKTPDLTIVDPVTKKPRLMTGDELAKLYGITADRGAIEKLLLNAVDTKYTNLDRAQARTERNYYDQVATSQDSLLDVLRKNRTNAVMTGATKGMNAANELAAMLMTSQQNSLGATTVAQTGADLAKQKEADRAAAVLQALTTANAAGSDMMGRAAGMYDSEYVGYSADQAAASNILAEKIRAASNKDVANISAAGSLAAAKASAAGYSSGGGGYSSNYTAPTVDPAQQKIANLVAIGSTAALKEAERLMGLSEKGKAGGTENKTLKGYTQLKDR